VVLCELRKVFIDIKYYRDRYNEQYRIDICANELAYDVPVYAFDISERVEDIEEM
jgi:hypothetical protein